MSSTHLNSWRLLGFLGIAVLVAFGCDSAVDDLKSMPTTGADLSKGAKREKKAAGELFSSEESISENVTSPDDEEAESLFGGDSISPTQDDEDAEIVFPIFDFSGNGIATCKGETYPSTAGIITSIDEDNLDIHMHRNRVNVGGKGQSQADEKMAKSRGHTLYSRVLKNKLTSLKADGFEYAPYVIFANGVHKQAQNQKYQFDSPLPVYPWPAPITRYDDLDKGPQSWTAKVTGHMSFTATITVSKVSQTEDSVVLNFRLDIKEDTNRALYEDFPVPREADYTINTKQRDIEAIETTNWHLGDENCNNAQERIQMTYRLCKKTTGDKVTETPCT